SIAITELEEAFTDDRADHTFGRRLDHPDRARLAVGHVEPHAVRGESARLVHRRLLPRPVLERFAPGARMRADAIASEHHRPELMSPGHGDVEHAGLDHAVMTGVGHEETAAGLVGQELSREQQRRGRCRLLTGEPERPAIENTGSLELGDHLADEPIEGLELELALVLADHLAARID